MKRFVCFWLSLMLLVSAAYAADSYNSFMDDSKNAGIYDQFAWDGEYVYWLHTPNDGSWANPPANLYRMVPGSGEAQLLLEGSEDLYIHSMLNIGDSLLLSVSEEIDAQSHPALINFDGSDFRMLPGNIGSVVPGEGAIYNCADGEIYRISLKDMKPKRIYKFPANLLDKNPVLKQYADGKLYYSTEEHAWYEFDVRSGKVIKIAEIRGEGFVLDGMLYISDLDAMDGTWRYDISSGNRVQVSERIYNFQQGSGSTVLAVGDDPDSWFQGVLFDFSAPVTNLEEVRTDTCDEYYDVLLDGRILHYNWQKNRVDWKENLVGEF